MNKTVSRYADERVRTSFGVDKGTGWVQVEDDLMHEGAYVLSADTAYPDAPVKRESAPQRRLTGLARVAHFQPDAYAHLQKIKIQLNLNKI